MWFALLGCRKSTSVPVFVQRKVFGEFVRMADNIDVQQLIEAAKQAMAYSHSPYSKFPVGAALLTEDGKIITGCNVENACYPVGICAEQTAIVKAISEGHRKFKAIAVIAEKSSITPCGMCRQSLREISKDLVVYCVNLDRTFKATTLQQLLPDSFGPEQLGGN